MTTLVDGEWISLEQFCTLTGWAKGTVHNRISKGNDMPDSYVLGNRIRFPKADVEAWLKTRRRVSAERQIAQLHATTA